MSVAGVNLSYRGSWSWKEKLFSTLVGQVYRMQQRRGTEKHRLYHCPLPMLEGGQGRAKTSKKQLEVANRNRVVPSD